VRDELGTAGEKILKRDIGKKKKNSGKPEQGAARKFGWS